MVVNTNEYNRKPCYFKHAIEEKFGRCILYHQYFDVI